MPLLPRLIWNIKSRFGVKKDTEPYLFLFNILGYKPKRMAPYILALRHKSVDGKGNERLEFLGDAVISLVVGDFLFQHFRQSSEGQLTSFRARLVCRDRLNTVAWQLGLHQHLDKSVPLGKNAEDVYGNSLEALVGAIYMVDGFDRAKSFIERYLLDKTAMRLCMPQQETDFKSKLLEWGQHQHQQVSFCLLNESYDAENDQHNFVYGVKVNEQVVAQGAGHTKKEAQQRAAKAAMHVMN